MRPPETTEEVTMEPGLGTHVDEVLETQLKELGEMLETIKRRIEERKGSIDSIYERRLAELKEKNEEVQKKIHRIKESGERPGERIKTGFGDLWAAFDRAVAK